MSTVAIFVGMAIFWLVVLAVFNRGADRIQLATVCLFFCILSWGGALWQAHGSQHVGSALIWAGGIFISVMYVALAALAIFYKRWAWRLVVTGFGIHLLATLILFFPAIQNGAAGVASIIQWVLLGAVGLWASAHSGSKVLLGKNQNAGA